MIISFQAFRPHSFPAHFVIAWLQKGFSEADYNTGYEDIN
jgi:hypothetical protein